jgi:hypothetical protein
MRRGDQDQVDLEKSDFLHLDHDVEELLIHQQEVDLRDISKRFVRVRDEGKVVVHYQ